MIYYIHNAAAGVPAAVSVLVAQKQLEYWLLPNILPALFFATCFFKEGRPQRPPFFFLIQFLILSFVMPYHASGEAVTSSVSGRTPFQL